MKIFYSIAPRACMTDKYDRTLSFKCTPVRVHRVGDGRGWLRLVGLAAHVSLDLCENADLDETLVVEEPDGKANVDGTDGPEEVIAIFVVDLPHLRVAGDALVIVEVHAIDTRQKRNRQKEEAPHRQKFGLLVKHESACDRMPNRNRPKHPQFEWR